MLNKTPTLFLLLLFIAVFSSAKAQTLTSFKLSSRDNDYGRCVQADANGYIYTTGAFSDTVNFNPSGTAVNLISSGGTDVYLAKYRPNGTLVWAKKMGGTGDDLGVNITIDASGNLLFTAQFSGTANFNPAGTANFTSHGGKDIFFGKYDTSGAYLLGKSIGGPNDDIANSIKYDASGNIFIGGAIGYGTTDADPAGGGHNLVNSSSYSSTNIFYAKYTSTGTYTFAKSLSGCCDAADDLLIDASGDIYITGGFQGYLNFDPNGGSHYLSASYYGDIFLAKYSGSTGAYVWANSVYGPNQSDWAHAMVMDASGNIYITGEFSPSNNFDLNGGTYNLSGTDYYDVFVVKYKPNGHCIWAKDIGGSGVSEGRSIAIRKNLVAVTGYFPNTLNANPGGTFTLTSTGGYDMFYDVLDTAGTFVTAGSAGSSGYDDSYSITFANDSTLYFTGLYSADFTVGSQTLTNKGAYDAFVTKAIIKVCPYTPTITSVTKTTGVPSILDTINGTNFSISGNSVYFGGVKATVQSSTATRLVVTVPFSAAFAPICVTNGCGISKYTTAPFIEKYSQCNSTLSSSLFASRTNISTITHPNEMNIGDMDGDGLPDIVVSNDVSTLAVHRNTSTPGTISFSSNVNFTAGSYSATNHLADLDGDGKLDIAVANYSSNSVSVFRNISTPGSFTTSSLASPISLTTGSGPYGITTADFDGDGKVDIVVSNESSNTISVFLNTSSIGSLSFASKSDFSTQTLPGTVAYADIDGDGKFDIIVANRTTGSISVFKNTSTVGNLSFSRTDYSTSTTPRGIAIADLNGDGKPEVAVICQGTNLLYIFKNNSTSGTVSLSYNQSISVGNNSVGVDAADVDGDGFIDLFTDDYSGNTISFIRNTSSLSTLTFSTPFTVATGNGPVSHRSIDIDGDGKPDAIVANYTDNTISVFKNITSEAIPVITSVTSLARAAGAIDTINGSNFTASATGNTVLFGAVKATVTSATTNRLIVSIPNGSTYNPITVTNGCGMTGYAQTPFNATNSCLSTFSLSSTSLTNTITTNAGSPYYAYNAGLADIDGDGKPDIISANYGGGSSGTFSVNLNNSSTGSPSFSSAVSYSAGLATVGIAYDDLDGDGQLDVATTAINGNSVSVYRNISSTGNVSFLLPVTLAVTGACGITINDIDGDGKPDIIVGNYQGSYNTMIFLNTSTPGKLSFASGYSLAVGGYAIGVKTADIDGDGKPDIIASNYTTNQIVVVKNNSTAGSLSFATPLYFNALNLGQSTNIDAGDIDGDGKPDIVYANSGGGYTSIGILRNTSTGGTISFASASNYTTPYTYLGVRISDINGDNKPDILACGTVGQFSVFQNNSTSGTISLTRNDYALPGNGSWNILAGDIDNDGKTDVIVPEWSATGDIVVFKNTIAPIVTPTQTVMCNGRSTTLDAGSGYSSYSWSNGATTQTVNVSSAGRYKITVNGCSADSSSAVVYLNPVPTLYSFTGSSCLGGGVLKDSISYTPLYFQWNLGGSIFHTDTAKWYTSATTVAGTGYSGSGSNALSYPSDMYADAGGNLYVCDYYNHRVQKFAPGSTTGVTVAGGNGAGSALNQLYYNRDMAVDMGGNIYVCEQYNHRVTKWAPGATSGVVVAGGNGAGSAANQLYYPLGVFVDTKGNIYVADYYNNRVQKWTPGATSGTTVAGGNGLGSAANQLYYPIEVYVDTSGNVFVADWYNNRIQKWAPGASSGTTVAGGNGAGSANNQLNQPTGIILDPAGNMYITDWQNNRVVKWLQGASSGTPILGTGVAGSGANQFNLLCSSYIDVYGNFYVADQGNHRIQKFTSYINNKYTPVSTGSYTVYTTGFDGCNATSSTISEYNKATAVTTGNATICKSGSATVSVALTGSTPWSLTWSNGTATHTVTGISTSPYTFSVSPTADSTYTVTALSAGTCASSAGDITGSAAITVNPVNKWIGAVSSDWNTAANWCGAIPTSSIDVYIPSTAAHMPVITGTAACNNLTIGNGGTLNVSGGNLTIMGNLTDSGTFSNASGSLNLNGNTAQTLPGGLQLHDLVINNSAGVTISGKITVSNVLTLTYGILSADTVFITNNNPSSITGHQTNANIAGYSSSSYIHGILKRNISGTGTYHFPIGTAGNYQLITITNSNLTGTNSLLVKYNNSNTGCSTPIGDSIIVSGTKIHTLLDGGYWSVTPDIEPTGGSYSAFINERGYTTYPGAASQMTVIKRSSCSSTWKGLGTHTNSTQFFAYNTAHAERTGLTSFSDFGMGWGDAPLPVTIESFTATAISTKQVNTTWTVTSQHNNKLFNVQRSADGVNFSDIGKLEGCGTCHDTRIYNFTDGLPYLGTSYYRIQQVDNDGIFSYSQIAPVTLQGNAIRSVQVYPNPTTGVFNIDVLSANATQACTLRIENILGQTIQQQIVDNTNGHIHIPLNGNDLANGVYIIHVLIGADSYMTKLVIQK